MMLAEPRREPADERLVGQQRVEVDGCLGNADALPIGRDAAVEIGECLAVAKPFGLGHEAFDQMEEPPAAVDKALQQFFRIRARLRAPLIKPGLRTPALLPGPIARASRRGRPRKYVAL